MGQEEHFVGAIEVVTFGAASFFRSLERPKPFIVPVTDYEVIEVREQRLVLKAKMPDGGSVKIGHGHEEQKKEPSKNEGEEKEEVSPKVEKRKERRQRQRKKDKQTKEKGNQEKKQPEESKEAVKESVMKEAATQETEILKGALEETAVQEEGIKEPHLFSDKEDLEQPPALFRTVLPPPATLIRENLNKLREDQEYQGAFYDKDVETTKEVPPQEETFRLDSMDQERAQEDFLKEDFLQGELPLQEMSQAMPQEKPQEVVQETFPEEPLAPKGDE